MLEIKNNSRSFSPIIRNGWGIKFSTYRNNNILLLFTSLHTGQTLVRYFTDEDSAVDFINYVIEHSPVELIDQ
jgi:hypothetical protein